MALFQKGIVLEQFKEPALSKKICEFFNSGNPFAYINEIDIDEKTISQDQIIEIAKIANIVDESDGVDLYKKFMGIKNIVTVVADAIDDEPYISSQMAPVLKMSDQLVGGLRYAQKAIMANRIYIAMYKNIGETNTKIPNKLNDVEVRHIQGRYPAEQRAKKRIRQKKAIIIGSGALIHLYRAIKYNRKQTTTFLTVAGNAVANPMNLEVSLGMTIMQVLEKCGLSEEVNRIAIGGSMTGIGIIDADKTLITPTTRSILAFKDESTKYHYTCIGCGKCTENCPMGLSPYYIYKLINSNQMDKLQIFDADSCIGCGICSYNCPAKLEISKIIFDYAQKIRKDNKESQNQLVKKKEKKKIKSK